MSTSRARVEQGLRQVVAERKLGPAFKLRKASFKGRGLCLELTDAGWDRLRDLTDKGEAPDPRQPLTKQP